MIYKHFFEAFSCLLCTINKNDFDTNCIKLRKT